MRSPWCALAGALLVGCGGGVASSTSSDGGSDATSLFPEDAGHADARPTGDGAPDAWTRPACTSIPSVPTGTVAVDGGLGFSIAGVGASRDHPMTLGPDGGFAPQTTLSVSLTDQVSTCAYGPSFYTGVGKAGIRALDLEVTVDGTADPPLGTYASFGDFDGGIPPLYVAIDTLSPDCSTLNGMGTYGTLAITSISADRVQGVFTSEPPGTTVTFDAPFCPSLDVQPACCVP